MRGYRTGRLVRRDRFAEPSIVFAPYVPICGHGPGDSEWMVIIVRQVDGMEVEYLAEDRHDGLGTPFWVSQPDDPFVLRFWNLQDAQKVIRDYPGAHLECVRAQ